MAQPSQPHYISVISNPTQKLLKDIQVVRYIFFYSDTNLPKRQMIPP